MNTNNSTILNSLSDENVWIEYYNFKSNQASMSQRELNLLNNFIQNKCYLPIATEIKNNTYTFSIPEKHLINKINKSEKRVVYNFNENENYI